MGVKERAFTWSEITNKAVYGVNTHHTAGYPVKPSDLEELNASIEKWSQFLRHVFLGSSLGYISEEDIEQLSLEDTERYLDVKIQLSRCFSSVQDDILANRLETICNDIRKNSYKFISATLPVLNENSRHMVEMKNNTGMMNNIATNVNPTGEYNQNLSMQRKKVMSTSNRQHRDVIHGLAQLTPRLQTICILSNLNYSCLIRHILS